jgi:hypothetical protein
MDATCDWIGQPKLECKFKCQHQLTRALSDELQNLLAKEQRENLRLDVEAAERPAAKDGGKVPRLQI